MPLLICTNISMFDRWKRLINIEF